MQRRVMTIAFLCVAAVASAQESLDVSQIYLGSQPCRMLSGAGSPEGNVVAAPCSTYYRTSDGMIWRKATGTGSTGWVEAALPTGSANQVLVHTGSAVQFSGTPTVSTLTATTSVTTPEIISTGDLELNPGGNDVLPKTGYSKNLGLLNRKWLSLHAAELWVSTLVAQDVMSTIGGRVVVAPTTELAADLAAAGTSISVKHNNLAIGDRLFLEGNGMFEAMAITSGPSGSGPYTYSVTRNLDGSGANDWPAGSAVLNTGTTGDGFIDLYADNGLVTGSTFGPTIVGNVRTGTTYNAVAPRWAIGNLNGLYGYATDIYGAAFGDPSNAWLKVDATNGVRIGHGSTTLTEIDASGNASFAGRITSTSGSIGSWSIDEMSLSATGVGLYAERFYTSALELDGGNENASRAFASFTTDNFTLGAWVYVDAITTTHYPLYIGDFAGGGAGRNGYGILVDFGSNAFQGVFFNPSGNVFIGSAPVTTGQWTHVALRRQGGVATLFVNGVPAGTTSTSAPVRPDGRFTVGALYSSGSYINGLDGRVAHAFLTHQALSNAAISAMAGGGPSDSGLAPFLVSPGDYAAQTPLLHYFPLQGASNLAEYGGAGIGALTPTGTLGTASGPDVAENWPRVEVGSGTTTAGVSRCLSANDIVFWAGAAHGGRSGAPFRVNCQGGFVAQSGAVGGWNLGSTSLSSTNILLQSGAANTARIQVGTGSNAGGLNSGNGASDICIWAGNTHANRASAAFRVTCGGSVTMTSGSISGATLTFGNDITIGPDIGIAFASAGGDDTDRAVHWANGSRIMERTDVSSLHLRGPGISTINLYAAMACMWADGAHGVCIDSTAQFPETNMSLQLGKSGQRYSIGYLDQVNLANQFPILFEHSNFKNSTQYLCVDSAGRVFASSSGC